MLFPRTIHKHHFEIVITLGLEVVPEVQFKTIVSVSSISSIIRSSQTFPPFSESIRCPLRTTSSYSPDLPSRSSSTITFLHLYPLTNSLYSLSTSTISGLANSTIHKISPVSAELHVEVTFL